MADNFLGTVKIVSGADKTPNVGGVTRDHITATTAGTYTIATTVAETSLNLLGLVVTSDVATRVQFASAATTISPFFNVSATVPLIFPPVGSSKQAYLTTTAGEGLLVEVDGGGIVGKTITVSTQTNAE